VVQKVSHCGEALLNRVKVREARFVINFDLKRAQENYEFVLNTLCVT